MSTREKITYCRPTKLCVCILSIIAACSLSACAPMAPSQNPPEMKDTTQLSTSQSFTNQTGEWPTEQWWRNYHDAQLDTLIDEALANAPTMTIAQARLQYANAMTRLADSALQPQIYAGAAASSQKISYNYTTPASVAPHGTHGYGTMMLDFNWEIDFWGKNRAALAAATSQAQAAEADLAQARLTLTTAIASEYGELSRLYLQKDTIDSLARVRKKTYELFTNRQKFGLETQAAVEQAKARYAQLTQQQAAIGEQILVQKHRLAALMGAGPDRGLQITRPTLALKNDVSLPQSLELELLGRRPDIVAAKLRVQAGESLIERQKAEFYPNVNLSSFIGYQAMGLGNLLKSGSDTYGITPAISLPIFTGGRLNAQLEGARADHAQAIGVYNQTLTQALEEVADAITRKRKLATQLESINTALTAAEKSYQLTNNRYKGGLSNYLEVLQADETRLAVLQTHNDLKAQIFTRDIALIHALGGGYEKTNNNK